MSSLKIAERQILEQHFGMARGDVLNFSHRTFGEFVFRTAVGVAFFYNLSLTTFLLDLRDREIST